jgi:hypothetical protein
MLNYLSTGTHILNGKRPEGVVLCSGIRRNVNFKFTPNQYCKEVNLNCSGFDREFAPPFFLVL